MLNAQRSCCLLDTAIVGSDDSRCGEARSSLFVISLQMCVRSRVLVCVCVSERLSVRARSVNDQRICSMCGVCNLESGITLKRFKASKTSIWLRLRFVRPWKSPRDCRSLYIYYERTTNTQTHAHTQLTHWQTPNEGVNETKDRNTHLDVGMYFCCEKTQHFYAKIF